MLELLRRFLRRSTPVSLKDRYHAAIGWIRANTLDTGGVRITADVERPYPEVTGYLIPTLLSCGQRDLAAAYARWLVSCQNDDGSWLGSEGDSPYTFDTGQILKGLFAMLPYEPSLADSIERGCRWLLSQVAADGRVTTPDAREWALPGNRVVPEAIHLYALEPLRLFGGRAYDDAVERALDYYTSNPRLVDFDTLGHFHAYVLEALVDLGRPELAAAGMRAIASAQKRNGFIPAYSGTRWSCSVAQFQYALVWFKLGEEERAVRAFSFGCSLQNASGGFYGGYGRGASYFPNREISWGVKYFLDAFWWKIRIAFNRQAAQFPSIIDANDGRYRLVLRTARARILEAGCGKGRFLRQLQNDLPQAELTGLDLSDAMLQSLPAGVRALQGTLLNIPAIDGSFDLVFCIEALEHAVDIRAAIHEMCRVVAPGGTLLIIDKDVRKLGALKIEEWEQWFDESSVARLLAGEGFDVEVEHDVTGDGLFIGWIARRRDR